MSSGSKVVVDLTRDAEAQHLVSYLATRISITINRRLAKALDNFREHNKPASRERFEPLLSRKEEITRTGDQRQLTDAVGTVLHTLC